MAKKKEIEEPTKELTLEEAVAMDKKAKAIGDEAMALKAEAIIDKYKNGK